MAQINNIKHFRDELGLNISEIAHKVGVRWRTVKKYVDGENQAHAAPRQRRKYRVLLAEYAEKLKTWILEDQRRWRKYRHTARTLYHQLVKETSYRGSEKRCGTSQKRHGLGYASQQQVMGSVKKALQGKNAH